MEKAWRQYRENGGDPMKAIALRALISPTSADEHAVVSPVLAAWDIRGTQLRPPIEPTSVTAGHTAKTSLSQGGL